MAEPTAADKKGARELCDALLMRGYPYHPPGRCVPCDRIAAALANAREEGERRAIGVLHDALAGAYAAIDPEENQELSERLSRLLECDGPGPCHEYQRNMDEAREEGERSGAARARKECWEALHDRYEAMKKRGPMTATQPMEAMGDALDAIASLGPMVDAEFE